MNEVDEVERLADSQANVVRLRALLRRARGYVMGPPPESPMHGKSLADDFRREIEEALASCDPVSEDTAIMLERVWSMADIGRWRLNVALAEHLFELRLLPHEGFAPRLRHDTGIVVVTDPYSGLCEPLIEDVPDYLTWEGMGLVIDAMRAKGWEFSLQMFSDAICWAKFATVNRQGYDYEEANTAPEAVALAALRALGVEFEAQGG